MHLRKILFTSTFIVITLPLCAQVETNAGLAPVAATAQTPFPALFPYATIAEGAQGKPLTGEINLTFLLFRDQTGGEPIWTESQLVALDPDGHYAVLLGAASPTGVPLSTFSSGEARWLEVQIPGQKQQARVLLTSVPYAARSADASTLGGLPASAFMLAGSRSLANNAMPTELTAGTSANVTTTGGTSGYLPLFSGTTTVVSSEIVDTGTSVGIGHQPNPVAKLDVDGPMIMRGSMTVSRTGNATAAAGYPSYGFDFFSNAYNSSTRATDNPHFQLQSEPVGNNTANTAGGFYRRGAFWASHSQDARSLSESQRCTGNQHRRRAGVNGRVGGKRGWHASDDHPTKWCRRYKDCPTSLKPGPSNVATLSSLSRPGATPWFDPGLREHPD